MKKLNLFLLTVLLTLSSNICFPQLKPNLPVLPQNNPGSGLLFDTSIVKYVPMSVGNVYTYYCSTTTGNSYTKVRVTRDTVAFGHRYYYYEGVPGVGNGFTRLDSATGLLLQLYPFTGCGSNINDKVIDSLSARLNDSLNYCLYYGVIVRRCSDTSNITLFNTYNTKRKTFFHDGLITYYISYAMNIGLCGMYTVEVPPNYTYYELRGCKVNGTVYGDTNVYYTVAGNIQYSDNGQPATNGYVKAIKLDRSTGNIITFDSAQIQPNGSYILTHVPQDSVDIGVYPNSTTQNDWIVTYYPSTVFWRTAIKLYPTGNLANINTGVIRMYPVINTNSINGKVMRLNDFILGNLKDAVLYAKSGNTFVRCGISDANGVYHLPSLPAGSIKVLVDRLGFSGDSTIVNITASSNIDSVNFYLNLYSIGIRHIGSVIPAENKLDQNYPNPFNPATNIKYQIALHGGSSTNNKLVTLKVYDLLGKEVVTLVNENQSPGVYEVTFDAGSLPSGVYFYKLQAGDFLEVKKMLLIK